MKISSALLKEMKSEILELTSVNFIENPEDGIDQAIEDAIDYYLNRNKCKLELIQNCEYVENRIDLLLERKINANKDSFKVKKTVKRKKNEEDDIPIRKLDDDEDYVIDLSEFDSEDDS